MDCRLGCALNAAQVHQVAVLFQHALVGHALDHLLGVLHLGQLLHQVAPGLNAEHFRHDVRVQTPLVAGHAQL